MVLYVFGFVEESFSKREVLYLFSISSISDKIFRFLFLRLLLSFLFFLNSFELVKTAIFLYNWEHRTAVRLSSWIWTFFVL